MRTLGKVACWSLVISCLAVAGARGAWIENGSPITRQWSSGTSVIVTDGSYGSIVAYWGCIEGVRHIIAQRIDSEGNLLWGEDGIDVCEEPAGTCTYINELQMTSDGLGGAIIAWSDNRGGDEDIYAQRVNASGVVQWTENGIALCTATGSQTSTKIASDGARGAIVAWVDYRAGNDDIYAQRVNSLGVIMWSANGVALCTSAGSQDNLQITADGAGGAIVTWQDNRRGDYDYDIYAQRVNASGSVQWTGQGKAICTGVWHKYSPQITADDGGGAIIAWHDNRSGEYEYDIYAQRVNAAGVLQWLTEIPGDTSFSSDGIAVCAAAGDQYDSRITADEFGGAIITWRDDRSYNDDIYAQRVNASGSVQWTLDGVPICTAAVSRSSPQIAGDGAGGATITWCDERSRDEENDIYAQRVNASGIVQWALDGVAVCTAAGERYSPNIATDDAGGAIIAWRDHRNGSQGIYAQRMNASGLAQWTDNGVRMAPTQYQHGAATVSDGAGGVIAAWTDNDDVYAQHVDVLGNIQWTVNGILLCNAAKNPHGPAITADGGGGAIITWYDERSGDYDIYAQRVDASGNIQWGWDLNGIAICTALGAQGIQQIIADGAGGAIVTWQDGRGGEYEWDIYAQRVNSSGIVQWALDGVAICTTVGEQSSPQIAADGGGGAIITWQDSRSGDYSHIYAQRVNDSSSVQWILDGIPICTAAGSHSSPQIAADGAGGAIITWSDDRSGNHIYAQRVDASGNIQSGWDLNGIAICTAARWQRDPQITADGVGGAIITWIDERNYNEDIYAQRVNTWSDIYWPVNGIPICTEAEDQSYPEITSDGAEGAIITWQDDRRSGEDEYDIYAQRVNASGSIQWMAEGKAICVGEWGKFSPRIVADGGGGAIVAWVDQRCGTLIYAQRIDAAGHVSPETATLLQNHSAALEGGSIRIDWILSEIDDNVRFSVSRASSPDWEFTRLGEDVKVSEGLSFTFIDRSCLPGRSYKYRVECEAEGVALKVLFETHEIAVPARPLTLFQNHPNPFNPSTVIRFYLPETQQVALDVYNAKGERVVKLAEGKLEKGYHEIVWDGRNGSGMPCTSGLYFYRLKAGKETISRKMLIMR